MDLSGGDLKHAPSQLGEADPALKRHVAVLVINWNQASLAVRAVRSALASTGVRVTAVVIDNGSRRGAVNEVTRTLVHGTWRADRLRGWSVLYAPKRTDVLVILAGDNLGFTGANNVGFEVAFAELGTDYCFLLNCDAELAPAALSKLVDAAEGEPQIGLVGALILDGFDSTESTVSFGRGQLSVTGWPTSLDRGRPRDSVPSNGVTIAEIVGGAAMLVPRSTYETIGGQDDRYFFDVDDTEISLRALRAGLHNLMVWDAIVKHEMGSSVTGRSALSRYYNVRNLLRLQADYLEGWQRVAFLVRMTLRVIRDLTAALLRFEPARALAVLSAVKDHLGGRTGRGPDRIYRP